MDVVYVDIDSLRPDHLGCYGYGPATTPNIDAFAADAVRFSRAFVANSPCMPSRAGLLSGRYGVSNGVVTHGEQGRTMSGPQWESWERPAGHPRDWVTLPELFFTSNRRAAAVSSFPRHPSPWFYHLWDTFRQPREEHPRASGTWEYFQTPRAQTVTDDAVDLLEAYGDCFLYAQYWDPHVPYNRSEDEIERFRGETPLPARPTAEQFERHQTWDTVSPPDRRDLEDREDLRDQIAHYDAEIRHVDAHVGRLLDALRERGRYEDALIVLTADHGEEFGEHGEYGNHAFVYEGAQHVPLLVKPPASAAVDPGVCDHLVTNVDLPPTIADYAGLRVPGAWQGRTLRGPLEGTVDAAAWRDHVVLEHGLATAQRAVRTDRWKFVRTYHPGLWEGVLPERQLFDLDEDPHEQSNVAADNLDVVGDLEARMATFVERHVGPRGDPLRTAAAEGPSQYQRYESFVDGV